MSVFEGELEWWWTVGPLWKSQECLTKFAKFCPFLCTILYKSCVFNLSWHATPFERPPFWVAFIEGFHCIYLEGFHCIKCGEDVCMSRGSYGPARSNISSYKFEYAWGRYRLAYTSALVGSLPHFKASFRPPTFSQNFPLSIKIWSACVSGLDDATDSW